MSSLDDPKSMQAIPVPIFERHNTCVSCGLDLFGHPRSGTCPQCGTSTRESTANAASLVDSNDLARFRSGALMLLLSSIFAGLCPGVCFLFASTDGSIVLALLMTLVFGLTAATAAIGERRLAALCEDPEFRPNGIHVSADAVAGVGLLAINIAAYLYGRSELLGSEKVIATIVALGFFLLALTAWRAVPSYRMRAAVWRSCLSTGQPRRNGGFIVLGFAKAIYETIWLCCCWIPAATVPFDATESAVFLAFGALFGLGGFAVLWVLMIVQHAMLFVKAQQRHAEGVRGFEILASH